MIGLVVGGQGPQPSVGGNPPQSPSPEKKGLSNGAVVGITLGATALVIALVALALVVRSSSQPTLPKELVDRIETAHTRLNSGNEAMEALDRIYNGAAVYFAMPRVSNTGEKLPCQFPASQATTPTAGTCCAANGGKDVDKDGRCDADAGQWNTSTWSALKFQMNDQHFFVYAFESEGTGRSARFTVSAYGDLDCDGMMSTFRRTGVADPSANGCTLKGEGEYFVDRDRE